jgi:hypothetical protein
MTISPELLVTKGLLPENVPPVFTAARIWPTFGEDGTAYTVTSKVIGEPCIYNASKRGGQRRMFGIPHPTFVKDQGLFFEKHWADIQALLGGTPGSLSKPGRKSRHPVKLVHCIRQSLGLCCSAIPIKTNRRYAGRS